MTLTATLITLSSDFPKEPPNGLQRLANPLQPLTKALPSLPTPSKRSHSVSSSPRYKTTAAKRSKPLHIKVYKSLRYQRVQAPDYPGDRRRNPRNHRLGDLGSE
jgi:hypothetical protein